MSDTVRLHLSQCDESEEVNSVTILVRQTIMANNSRSSNNREPKMIFKTISLWLSTFVLLAKSYIVNTAFEKEKGATSEHQYGNKRLN